ncbi:hypothetical protein [Hahella chejuensis]|uniref:hypothetical protein n=1 Tax=Hahella chejuensis TaxID=158327 RepID=UPI0011D0CA9F|nr:hypothetical protein [Hahella chejuensis]
MLTYGQPKFNASIADNDMFFMIKHFNQQPGQILSQPISNGLVACLRHNDWYCGYSSDWSKSNDLGESKANPTLR